MFNKKPSEAELEKRREILRARGVPEAFIESLATRRNAILAWRFMPLVLLFGGIAVTVPLIGLAFRWQTEFVETPGLAALYVRGAILANYAHGQGFAFLPPLIGLMISPLWLFQFFIRNPKPYPAANVTASWLRGMTPMEEKAGGVVELPEKVIQVAKSPDDLIRAYNRNSLWIMTFMLAPSLILGVVAYFALANQYWAVMPDRIISRGFGDEQAYFFKDVLSVSVGCNDTKEDDIEYVAEFKGKSFDIPSAGDHFDPSDLFRRLETIDGTLRAQGTPYRRWGWGIQDPMAPRCLEYWSKKAGNNGSARLNRLLRVP